MGLKIKWIPIVNQYTVCCCSCTLKTGTIVIAWFGLICELIQTVDASVRLNYYEENLNQSDSTTDDEFISLKVDRQLLISRISTGLFHALVNGLLLYGAWKEIPGFMLPYVLTQFFIVVLLVIVVIVLSIFLLCYDAAFAVQIILIGGIISLFSFYLWAGVYTYYRQLEEMTVTKHTTQVVSCSQPAEEEPTMYREDMQKTYAQCIEYNVEKHQSFPV